MAIRALRSLDYNIRLSTRHLTLTQARTQKNKSFFEISEMKKTKEQVSPFFYWILPCLDPGDHRRKCVAKDTQTAAETSGRERERQRKKRK